MDGVLTPEQETNLDVDLKTMLDAKTVTIPIDVVQPLMEFMSYTLKSAFHLNKLVAGCTFDNIQMNIDADTRKRRRIITRLSQGFSANKKRRFAYSKLKHSLRDISQEDISNQILILEANAVVRRPSHRSVELMRNIHPTAQVYVTEHCGFNQQLLARLLDNNNHLTD